MGQQRGHILLKAIGEKQGYAVGRQHLHDLMHHALRHRQRAGADVNGKQEFALGVHGAPDPMGGAGQTLERLVLTDLAVFDGAEHSIQFIELHLAEL